MDTTTVAQTETSSDRDVKPENAKDKGGWRLSDVEIARRQKQKDEEEGLLFDERRALAAFERDKSRLVSEIKRTGLGQDLEACKEDIKLQEQAIEGRLVTIERLRTEIATGKTELRQDTLPGMEADLDTDPRTGRPIVDAQLEDLPRDHRALPAAPPRALPPGPARKAKGKGKKATKKPAKAGAKKGRR